MRRARRRVWLETAAALLVATLDVALGSLLPTALASGYMIAFG